MFIMFQCARKREDHLHQGRQNSSAGGHLFQREAGNVLLTAASFYIGLTIKSIENSIEFINPIDSRRYTPSQNRLLLDRHC